MQAFRSIIFTIIYNLSGAVAGALSVLIWPILPYAYRWRLVTLWNAFVIWLVGAICGVKFVVHGQKPAIDGPYVVLAKHQSTWETLFLQRHFGPVSTILKKELLRIPFFGWGLASMRPIAIDRSNPVQALKDVKIKGLERLKQGNNLLIFPEGTRTAVGTVGNYARSGADIAITAQVPVVAVAHDAGKYWPHKQYLKTPGVINVWISEPIKTEGRERKELTEEVKQWIETKLAK